jgi:DNA-binding LacI/PurR family transcriptional regulator
MGKITIKEIAERAGLSVSAVSYVLNNKKGVSEETRQRVWDIIKELDYTPNVNSRRLVLQRSFNILVCLDDSIFNLDNLFYTEILSAIVSKGEKLGYSVVLSKSGSDKLGERFAQNLSQHNADGIVFLSDVSENVQNTISAHGIPFLVVDSHNLAPSYPCIVSDTKKAAYTATKYMIEQGHRKIAYIGMDRIPAFYFNSFTGYKQALEEYELPIQVNWIQSGAHDETSAARCMKRIMSGTNPPTAVFCSADIFAVGAMRAAKESGFGIPKDFSFIGMDDIILSRYCDPALTTLRIDKEKMGSMAVQMLDDILNGKDPVSPSVVEFDQLIERGTVRKLQIETE